jgi:hypothetical protein
MRSHDARGAIEVSVRGWLKYEQGPDAPGSVLGLPRPAGRVLNGKPAPSPTTPKPNVVEPIISRRTGPTPSKIHPGRPQRRSHPNQNSSTRPRVVGAGQPSSADGDRRFVAPCPPAHRSASRNCSDLSHSTEPHSQPRISASRRFSSRCDITYANPPTPLGRMTTGSAPGPIRTPS